MEKGNNREKLIRSLIFLKHRSQDMINKKLSFPLPAADILLLSPIDLDTFNADYQNILASIKKSESSNKNIKKVLHKFPAIITGRYENSTLKRVLLVATSLLLFFPCGIYIYYLVLSRRGELKLKLNEIISTSHSLVHLIQQAGEMK